MITVRLELMLTRFLDANEKRYHALFTLIIIIVCLCVDNHRVITGSGPNEFHAARWRNITDSPVGRV